MKKLLDTATKTGLDVAKTALKIVHDSTDATGELIGTKIPDKIVKPKPVPEVNSRNVEKIVIPPQIRQKIPRSQEKYYEMEHYKTSKLVSDSTVPKFVTRKWK